MFLNIVSLSLHQLSISHIFLFIFDLSTVIGIIGLYFFFKTISIFLIYKHQISMVFTIELDVIAAVTVTYICTFAQPFCFSPIISVLIYVCFYLFAEINFVLNVSKFYHRLTNRSLPYICCSARKFSRSFIDTIFLYQRSQTPTASALGKILYIDFRTKTKQMHLKTNAMR